MNNTNERKPIVVIRDLANLRHLYLASDAVGYEPIPHRDIVIALQNGQRGGYADEKRIFWNVVEPEHIVDVLVWQYAHDDDSLHHVRVILPVADIDDRFREVQLKTANDDVIWYQIANKIANGLALGYIDTTSSVMTKQVIRWELA